MSPIIRNKEPMIVQKILPRMVPEEGSFWEVSASVIPFCIIVPSILLYRYI